MSEASRGASLPIRRIVLWRWSPEATAVRRLEVKEGLAYIRYGGLVDDLDYGEDLGIDVGPGEVSDLVLLRDHRDRASWDAYVHDPHHKRVGDAIDAITEVDRTARIDYHYNGPPSRRGLIRHVALYHWRTPPDGAGRQRLLDALKQVPLQTPAPTGLAYGEDLGLGTGHADWAVELYAGSVEAVRTHLSAPAMQAVDAALAAWIDPGRTSRIQHWMLSG